MPTLTHRPGTATRPPWRTLGVLAGSLVVLAGVALRFVTTSDLWLDEALSVHIAGLAPRDIPAALRQDGHPPLYYWILHGWMRVFGDGDLAVRSLSGVLGVAVLPLVWVAGRRLGGRSVAGVALLLTATSPFAIRYATEARMYSLVMVLVLVGWLALRRALDDARPVALGGVALASGLLLLTHYWALYFLAVVGALLVGHARRAGLAGAAATRRAATRAAVALAAGGLLFVPWLPSLWQQAQHTGTPWARPERPASMLMIALTDLGGGPFGEAQMLGVALALLAAVAVFARPQDRWRLEVDLRTVPGARAEAAVVAGTLAVAAVAGYATSSGFASRYIAVLVPVLLVVAAAGVSRVPHPRARALVVAALVVLGLAGGVRNAVTERTQGGEIGRAVAAEAGDGDVVAFCPDQLGPAVERHLPDGPARRVFPTGADAVRIDWTDYADRMAAGDPEAFAQRLLDEAGNGDVWLAWAAGYRTLDDRCEQVVLALQRSRPAQVVVPSGPTFEHANLVRFRGS